MLVLSRKVGEKIVITTPEGRRIELLIIEALRGKARVGVHADREVRVNRMEIEKLVGGAA